MDNIIVYLVASTVARVGAVALLVFRVQILVSLYRYNLRLAAFYDARADALELSDRQSPEQLATLVAALSPEAIDFGRGPRSPTDHVVEIAKQVIRARNPSDV